MIEYDYQLEKIEEYKDQAFKENIYSSKYIKKYNCCPHCGCKKFIKYGKYHGIQRYKCQNPSCNKTFSSTTNSVWKYLKYKPETWLAFIELMCEHTTLKECACKLHISVVTAFNWRHKILHAIENNYNPDSFKELVNIETYYTARCYKGSKNKHFAKKEKVKNKIDKLYCLFPLNIEIIFASEKEDLPLITVFMPDENVDEIFKKQVLSITDLECYMHQQRKSRYNSLKCMIDHNKNLPKKIRDKYDLKIDRNTMTDNIVEDERQTNFVASLASWKSMFKGIATKYVGHYYKFFSLLYSLVDYDYIKIFFNLLVNATYESVSSLKASHVENY